MISALLLPHTDQQAHSRTVDALRSAQVHDIVLLFDANDPEGAASTASLPVTPAPAAARGEMVLIGEGIASCRQTELNGVLIVPPGTGTVSHGMIVDLLHRFWVSHKAIVASRSVSGEEIHIVADSLFEEVRNSPPGETLKEFAARHAAAEVKL
jgi:hypothetical protein